MKKIALFGTSADPPTAGHQTILVWLSQNFDWVTVWASNNPLKSHQTPLEHRERMLRLLIEEIDPPRHNIRLYPELSNSRTLETVAKAREIWPHADFTLVVGSDLVDQLPRWYRIEALLQQVELLVVPRPGYPMEDEGLQELRHLGGKVAIASLTGPDVSSTAYRESGDAQALTATVEAYIYQKQLYSCQDAAPKRLQTR